MAAQVAQSGGQRMAAQKGREWQHRRAEGDSTGGQRVADCAAALCPLAYTSNNKNGFFKSQPHPQKISLVLSYCCLGIEMLQAHKKIHKRFYHK